MKYLIDKMLNDLEAGLDKRDVQYYFFGMPFGKTASISEQALEKGVLIIDPVATSLQSLTTGITDAESMTVRIILAKSIKDEFVKNAQQESGKQYLVRLMENKDSTNQLQSNTIRYIVRNNMRQWGILQSDVSIDYETEYLQNVAQGVAEATMTITQVDHFNQPV